MLQRAQELHDQLIHWRRTIHQHPELGFAEFRTAELVAKTLEGLGLRVATGVGKTGVVGYLGEGKPVVAIRADMDALPVQEANDVQDEVSPGIRRANSVSYASQVPGVMHACGHDTHVAMALGVATLLANEDLPGQVRFLFQPAEEVADEEGLSGAARMIEDGAMEGVDIVLGQHINSERESGVVEIGEGPVTAAVDTFYITLTGQGGHGAYPHNTVDTIYILGHVINAIHGIVSRRIDPMQPAVISIGTVSGGIASNVITQQVELSGTIRSMDEEVRSQLWAELESALGVARALGGDFHLEIEKGYPVGFNHPEAVALLRGVSVDLLGEDQIRPPKKGMGAEDFSLLAQQAPGAMFGLGARLDEELRPHHSPNFDIDESVLPIGTAILAEAARRYLLQSGRLEIGGIYS